ncbi:lytic transglycosylase domain-containing protein [Candidatus Enterovibrio escicola]|uniref:lytic transglycosylase domain-containing protein n=1 Tax=Candidatus Enterovibrio escicola TaxID=1927127 RepID=UPI001237FC04|nr:lytic transglycosylase domain-containing protein [Candidatus Enterovibrio escacola]
MVFSDSLFADPFLNASCKYHIDKDLIISIAAKESSLKTMAKNVNSDDSIDVCMMQINLKEWLPKLPNISREQIEEDVYLCVEIGAWVLAQNFESHGRQWLSIGAYKAGFASRLSETREAYIEDIKMIYRNVQDGFYDKRLTQLGVNRTNTQCL